MTTPPTPGERVPLAVRSDTMLFLGAIALTFIVGSLPVPWSTAAVIPALAALIMGIRALSGTKGMEGGRVLRVLLGVGIAMAALSLLSGLLSLIVLDELRARQECTSRAITTAAQEQCVSDFEDAVMKRLSMSGS